MPNPTARRFSALLASLPEQPFHPDRHRYVIFSDLHLGTPQFDLNRRIYLRAMDYYFQHGFTLLLLGDIEELHRYSIRQLLNKYGADVYARERVFLAQDRLRRIYGNHDIDWRQPAEVRRWLHPVLPGITVGEGLKLCWEERLILLLHGHQGSLMSDTLGRLGRIFLRFFAQPLGLYALVSPAMNHRRRRKVEQRYYDWAKEQGLLLITGHTHRPMFESLTKIEQIRIRIESLLRQYIAASDRRQRSAIAGEILSARDRFRRCQAAVEPEEDLARLGQNELLIPCYFNSGSGLHQDGLTAIELAEGEIRLVFLYDAHRPGNEEKHHRAPTFPLPVTEGGSEVYRRQILQAESLDYVFTRIRLLGDTSPDSCSEDTGKAEE
ncbi:MAG: metallophosphoesterase family protein [Acidobacteria bacterium]|nr:metallophosphoesterase family protein [Acidobacteriota bacterium]